MKVRMNIDNTPHDKKPVTEYGIIRKRLADRSGEYTLDQLTAAIESGGAFTPALMHGTDGDSWQSQQIIIADIDNDETALDDKEKVIKDETGHALKQPIEEPLTSDKALEICNAAGINPYCVYHTFSNSAALEKFRVVVVLDKPLTDKEEAGIITKRFAALLNNVAPGAADTAMADAARIILGSYKGSIFFNRGSITPLEVMRALPETEEEKASRAPRNAPGSYKPRTGKRQFDDVKLQRREDIENFDLLEYIMQTETPAPQEHRTGKTLFLNPCPICGHKDDFSVTGHLWRCLSDSKGQPGGSIIDYIMHREDKTLQEALKKFDNMMGYETIQYNTQPAADPERKEQKEETETRDDMTKFWEVIQTETYKPHPTGLKFFDRLVDGGIVNQSLMILLAAPAAGKTTLCQQIAEEMARNQSPVIYINLEMSREQMLAKAISSKYYRSGGSLTASEVLRGYEWSDNDRAGVEVTINEYKRDIFPHIRYNPDGAKSDVRLLLDYLAAVGNKAKENGTQAPAIVIDYLHLITSSTGLESAELIKQAVTGLKQYAIDYNTFVIAITAVNRDSMKKGQLTMLSGRDSSNIEYTGDYILSLNYLEVDEGKVDPQNTKEMSELQRAPKRRMILRVLKNRFGVQGKSGKVLFNAPYSIFYDAEDRAIPPAGFMLDNGAPAF